MRKLVVLIVVCLFGASVFGQSLEDTLLLRDFAPKTVHNLPVTLVEKAKYTVIDAHSHDYCSTDAEIRAWIDMMDAAGVAKTHLMSCSWIGDNFYKMVEKYAAYKDRFAFWCSFDYTNFDQPDWTERAVKALEKCHEWGAVGVGEMGDKGQGDLYAYPVEGRNIHLDDPKMKPLLEKCAELKMPVSIHIAEPIWMYEPMDAHNDGLMNGVNWHVDTTAVDCLGYNELIHSFENAVAANPKTIFIACHYLNMNQDLVRLGTLLDKYPNMYIDIAARVGEAANTPRATRAFLIKYADRVLFGTDNMPDAHMYHTIYRVLETDDEHFYEPDFAYHWYYSGFYLPNKVLKKIYYKNAQKLFK